MASEPSLSVVGLFWKYDAQNVYHEIQKILNTSNKPYRTQFQKTRAKPIRLSIVPLCVRELMFWKLNVFFYIEI